MVALFFSSSLVGAWRVWGHRPRRRTCVPSPDLDTLFMLVYTWWARHTLSASAFERLEIVVGTFSYRFLGATRSSGPASLTVSLLGRFLPFRTSSSVPTEGTEIPPMRESFTSACVDGKTVYCFGGIGLSGRLNDLYVYDVPSARWSSVSSSDAAGIPVPCIELVRYAHGPCLPVCGNSNGWS